MSRLPPRKDDTTLENSGVARWLSQVQGKAVDFAASMNQRAAGVAEQATTLLQHWSKSQLSVRSAPATGGPSAIGLTPVSARLALLPPAPSPESVLALQDCEQDVLGLWGWQQMYDPAGYNIDAIVLQKRGRLWAVSSLW